MVFRDGFDINKANCHLEGPHVVAVIKEVGKAETHKTSLFLTFTVPIAAPTPPVTLSSNPQPQLRHLRVDPMITVKDCLHCLNMPSSIITECEICWATQSVFG